MSPAVGRPQCPWLSERIVVGVVEVWKSRGDFQGAVESVEDHPLLLEPGTAASRLNRLGARERVIYGRSAVLL